MIKINIVEFGDIMNWRGLLTEAFNKPSSRNIRLALSLLFIALATIFIMTIFSVAIVLLHPDIALWETHLYTIIFTGLVASAVALFVLLRSEGLYTKISYENEGRKRAEEKISHLASFPSLNPNPIIETDFDGNLLYVNPSARTIFQDLNEKGLAHPILAGLKVVVNELEVNKKSYLVREVMADGSYFQETIHSVPDKKVLRIYGLDTTKSKRAEEALRESEEKYRELVENANSIILRWDMQGNLTFFNEFAETLFGYSKNEILSKNIMGTIVPLSESTGRDMADMIEDLKRYPEHYKLNVNENLCKNGDRVWIAWTNKAIHDEHGNVVEILSVGNDITERKRAEEALFESDEKLRSYFVLPLIGMALTSPEKGWIQANDKLCSILGYSREELFQTTWDTITHPDDLNNDIEKFNSILSAEIDNYTIEKRFIRKDGSIVHTEISVGCVRNPDKSARYVVGLMRDITEHKHADEDLKAAKAQAELYVDLMGHDINNIHQAALGYLELARDMPCDAREECLDKATEALQRSTRLINNVRKLQKFQDNLVQAYDVDVCEVLAGVHEEFATIPGKTVTLNLNGCTHCHVRADDLLHDVFSNLVGNAVKHTGDHACVSVSLDTIREDDREYCRVQVEDDGPGIPDESKKTLFNRSLKGTPRAKGMGLGLYIVKTLVENYGGRVWAEDRVTDDHTKGARFVVTLPSV